MDINTRKCPNCAGILNTYIEEKKKICPFCESVFYIEIEDRMPQVATGKQGTYPNIYKQESVRSEAKSCYNIEELCQRFRGQIGQDMLDFYAKEKLIQWLRIPTTERVFLGHDDTVFKSGKNGFAITETGIYCCEIFETPHFMSYTELSKCHSITWRGDRKDVILADSISVAYCCIGTDFVKNNLMSLFQQIWASTKKQ